MLLHSLSAGLQCVIYRWGSLVLLVWAPIFALLHGLFVTDFLGFCEFDCFLDF